MMAAAGGGTTTLVLSDHGFGSVRPRQYISQRLMRGGYIRPAAGGSKSLRGRVLRLATNTYMRFPFLRERVKSLRRSQLSAVKRTLRRGGLMPDSEKVDYSKSIIVPTNFGLRMWVNSRDTFSHGILSAEEKPGMIENVREFLEADRDPVDGRQIIAEVHRGSDLYHGEFAAQAPDLVIEYANFYDPELPTADLNAHLEGGHTLDGIFLSLGPDIRPARIEGATLMDLAPTILHLFGLAVPPDMDGRVLEEILTDENRRDHPVRHGDIPARHGSVGSVPDLTTEEEAEVMDQLRRLGYV
jgi:predicted AlkP superfamily phosphohydrolase/phosphomutase